MTTSVSSLLKETRTALQEIGVRPSKKLGQNFLVDENIVDYLIKQARLQLSDTVVEVGPGLGTMTKKILPNCEQLFAVEYDGRLFQYLSKKFSHFENFNIMHGDAVDFPVAALPPDITNYKIISNLPYSISSAWMDAVLGVTILPTEIHLIVQLETAQRYFAKLNTKDFCPISIFLQSAYDNFSIRKIARSSFYPMPDVDSAVISMHRKTVPFLFKNQTKSTIRSIFTMRRKQIKKIINGMPIDPKEWILSSGISESARPDNISIKQWQLLDDLL